MAKKKVIKVFREMAIVSPSSDKCIAKVSIQDGVIFNRIRDIWNRQGYTSEDCVEKIPKNEVYPLDSMTVDQAEDLYIKKGMLTCVENGHVLGIYKENKKFNKKGVKMYGQEEIRACV